MQNCIDVAVFFCFFFVRDVITVTGRSTALDDLSIVASLTPPAPSSVLEPHLLTSRLVISEAVSSPRGRP